MKTILITGGTSGIGLELVKYFEPRDYQLFFTTRNLEKAQKLIQRHQLQARPVLMDFGSLKSIDNGLQQLKQEIQSLDILINNAGTWEMRFGESQDGIERNFAINHLAPMFLTLQALPLLKAAPAARIINTSSGAHRRDVLNFADLEFRQTPYDGIKTYSQSKLCNLLFTLQLVEELKGTQITVNTVHPGYVKTELFNKMDARSWEGVPSAFEGARSAIYAAEAPELEGVSNQYLYQENIEERLSPLARDKAAAQKLWQLSLAYLMPFLAAKV